jgi:hypothetical protein
MRGGRWSSGGGAPVTTSPRCLIRARHELHEVTIELARKKKRDERDPSYPDHGGLELRRGHAHGGGGGSGKCALTSTR